MAVSQGDHKNNPPGPGPVSGQLKSAEKGPGLGAPSWVGQGFFLKRCCFKTCPTELRIGRQALAPKAPYSSVKLGHLHMMGKGEDGSHNLRNLTGEQAIWDSGELGDEATAFLQEEAEVFLQEEAEVFLQEKAKAIAWRRVGRGRLGGLDAFGNRLHLDDYRECNRRFA
ncbi:unnamed protein product [Calypogeia fissa]